MEDPKAWKPRKAWHLNVKEKETQKSTVGRIESKAKLPCGWVSGITMVWSRPWAKNGMC